MKRCWYCKGWVWPWQRIGWRVTSRALTLYWHPGCKRRVDEQMAADYDRWREENNL